MPGVDFADYFWGEKNEGFSVLQGCLKSCPLSAKELGEYLRDCARIQEDTSKAQLKILKQLSGSSSSSSVSGSSSPLLALLKPFSQRVAELHHGHMGTLSELSKRAFKYAEELSKKHKSLKEESSSTAEVVKSFLELTAQLNKSKELYKAKCLELNTKAPSKSGDKADLKFRKAQEDYKGLVSSYTALRETFEDRLATYARLCQEMETAHVSQMREFVSGYFSEVREYGRRLAKNNEDFYADLEELSVAHLLTLFTNTYQTGLEKPGPIEFEEEKLSVASGEPDSSDRSLNSDKLSLNSFSKSKGDCPPLSGSGILPPPSSSSSGGGGGGLFSSGNAAGSGKIAAAAGPSVQQQGGVDLPRLRTWSVARLTRKPSEISAPSYFQGSSKSSSKATSLLNLFLPNNNNNSGSEKSNNHSNHHQHHHPHQEHSLLHSPLAASSEILSIKQQQQLGPSGLVDDFLGNGFEQNNNNSSKNDDNNHDDKSVPSEEENLSRFLQSRGSKWFLKRRRDKKRKTGGGEKDYSAGGGDSAPESSSSNKMGSDGEDQNKSDTPTPEVGEASFDILGGGIKESGGGGSSSSGSRSRRRITDHHHQQHQSRLNLDPWDEFNEPKNNFSSSSDESDDETKHKIKVEIKPVSNSNPPISASVDELRSAIGTLDIAPPPFKCRPASALNERISVPLKKPRDIFENGSCMDSKQTTHHDIRRSQSQSHLVHSKPSEDLLGLSLHPLGDIDLNGGKAPSEEKSPNQSNNKATFTPESSPPSNINNNNNNSTDNVLDLSTGRDSKEVHDILSEHPRDSTPPSALPPTSSSSVRDRVSSSLIALPRPPSRHGPPYPLPQHHSSSSTSPNIRSSPFSYSSSSNNSKPAFGTSRGPSPLTLGLSESIPLAVAFQEVIHACFHGSDESGCQVRLIGDMMISFPAGIIQMITNNPLTAPLLFRIKNASVLESIVPNKKLINTATALSSDGETAFEFNMKNLKDLLKSQSMQNPNASYFNIDILKYQIRAQSGAKSCPLQLVAYWKCEPGLTDLRLNYKYNASALASPAAPLLNLSIAVPIDGGVSNMISKPTGTWIAENNRALWTFKELRADEPGLQALRGRFELDSGPGSQGTIAAQFNCEGSTLSGIDIELLGPGYRLSLIKKRFVSGKYICEAEGKGDGRFRYAFTPSNALGSDC
eukprot:TRINITY_DN3351_c0_g1_i2.p1 TRINITY_DN3351_c0_g1~~TRINITY_DN3351_c0_g1_i2.p1  ORF type:complete len:1174 (-),score=464.11 TRINITY_DN3351_c0_g1_i2:400-3921(-)